ncbi:hypothetical protein GVB59_002872 [Salmonella enterica]|nr:hypothetical protein [Salmonella enterica]
MIKHFHVSGYAVDRRGNTRGIHYDVRARNPDKAKEAAAAQALAGGWKYPRLLRVTAQAPRGPHGHLSPTP